MAAGARSYAAGRYAIGVDGIMCGFVKSVGGFNAKAEVIVENLGPTNLQKKHIGRPKYEPGTMDLGMGMSKHIYEWIRSYFDDAHLVKSGEVHACDFDGKSMALRQFMAAHIVEVGVPACDAASKEASYLNVKLQAEKVTYGEGTGAVIQGNIGPKQKLWVQNCFSFTLGSLPTTKTKKIDAFALKTGLATEYVGDFREPTLHAAKVERPNLKITLSQSDIKDWFDWYRSFVIEGNCSEGDELTGAITWYSPNRKDELLTVELKNVGIFNLEQAKAEANKEETAAFTVELYVEDFNFIYKGSDA